jgi:hypothetical protein
MNIKLISVVSALAVSAAVAQDYDDEYEESTSSTESVQEEEAPAAPAPEPASAAESSSTTSFEAPAASESVPTPAATGKFNVLHGNAYNTVNNQFGASTIDGDMNAVYKMNGRKLFYVEPTGEEGVLALGSSSMTYLLAFDNRAGLGMFTAGIATPAFGVAVDLAIDKTWTSNEQKAANVKNTRDESTTAAGDYINVKFGAPLGTFDIVANVYWLTFDEETDVETDNNGNKTEDDPDFWDLGASVTLSNGPSATNFAWAAGLDFLRQKSDRRVKAGNTTTETTNNNAYILIQPRFDFSFPVFTAENAQVFLGLNNRLPVYIFDEIENGNQTTNTYDFGLFSTPNILAEMALNENWILFGSAAFVWKVIDYKTESIEEGAANNDTSIISMRTNTTNASAGLRFSYDHLVIEASVADNLNNDTWSGLVGNLGIFLVF